MGVTNQASIAIGLETSVGVLPGSPTAIKYPLRGENFANPINYEESGEFRDDRLTTPYDKVSEDAAGGFDFNFRYGVFDPIIAGAFASTWGIAPTRDNAGTADSVITAVTNADSTYAVTAGGGEPFVPSQIVLAEGFGIAANNGVKHATTGSNDTALIVTETLTDEAAPAANARLTVVGTAGATADITATSTGLGSTLLDFTAQTNLKVGGWIKLSGWTVAALNAWARITAIAANALTLDNLPTGWATDAGTAQTISIWSSEIITIGDGLTKQTFFMQKKVPITSGFRYFLQYGLHATGFNIQTDARGRIVGRADFQGISGAIESTPVVASPSLPLFGGLAMTAGGSFVRLHEGGGAFASTVSIPNITFGLQNQTVPVPAAHLYGFEDIELAEAVVQFTGTLNFRNDSLYTKYRGSTETSLSAILAKNSQAYVIEAPAGYLTTADVGLPGPNQIIQMPFTFQAHANAAGAANKQYALHRFRYYQ